MAHDPSSPCTGPRRPRRTAEDYRWRRAKAPTWGNCLKCLEPYRRGDRVFAVVRNGGLITGAVRFRLCVWCGEALEAERASEKAPPPPSVAGE